MDNNDFAKLQEKFASTREHVAGLNEKVEALRSTSSEVTVLSRKLAKWEALSYALTALGVTLAVAVAFLVERAWTIKREMDEVSEFVDAVHSGLETKARDAVKLAMDQNAVSSRLIAVEARSVAIGYFDNPRAPKALEKVRPNGTNASYTEVPALRDVLSTCGEISTGHPEFFRACRNGVYSFSVSYRLQKSDQADPTPWGRGHLGGRIERVPARPDGEYVATSSSGLYQNAYTVLTGAVELTKGEGLKLVINNGTPMAITLDSGRFSVVWLRDLPSKDTQ